MCQGEGVIRSADMTMVSNRSRDSNDNTARSNNDNIESCNVKVKPMRKVKRALTATVGAGFAVSAAALLSLSDEVGDWLHSVAPHVIPNAEAGADIIRRAIEASKTCYKEGVNICLDAEGQVTHLYTYLSQWYLSPKQHVIETGISILVLMPLVYLYFRRCRARARLHRAAGTFGVKESEFPIKLWGALLMALVSFGSFLKLTKNELISHPAYVWQPCHVHSMVMGLCSFVDTQWSLLVLHVATTLWWGPFLAFVAPSLPTNPVEVVIFWGQHSLMLLVPFFRLTKGANWMFNDFWWNSVGFVFLTCYHWWWLAPVNIITGINVATMTVPPEALATLGKYYRLVWGVACMALQGMAVSVLMLLAWIRGQWPSQKPSKSARTSQTVAAAAHGGGGVLGDAVLIQTEKATTLVDG